MATSTNTRLLRLALPLVKTHGFTREALARSVLQLPSPEAHSAPLSDAAVSALFGQGAQAQHALIQNFFDGGIEHMKSRAHALSETEGRTPTIKDLLEERLKYNEQALEHLPSAFALLASNSPLVSLGCLQVPPLDPVPALKHAMKIADEACYLSGDTSTELSWYARRASLAAIYSAAELHQVTSPRTAAQFLNSLLTSSSHLKRSLDEIGLFSSYLLKSCKGIIKSTGVL